jgi:peroxiredoxin Q/BCP
MLPALRRRAQNAAADAARQTAISRNAFTWWAVSIETESYREDPTVVEEGKPAPDFELQSDSGEPVRLSDLRGQQVVLYFYPKDDTPGCTAQACAIRDAWGEFEGAGAVVLGVSPDGEASHVKFKEKYDLPFTLLADPEHTVSEQYGVWGEKKYMGRSYMGVNRSTFVIGDDGNVKRVMHNVKPDTHADEVLETLRA